MTDPPSTERPFANLRTEVRELVRQLGDLQELGLGQRSPAVEDLSKRLDQPLFTVAISGPSRVGKSTLINALLGRTICPMSDFPKTGIPCVFEPGEKDEFIVKRTEADDVIGIPTPESLDPWVGREENEDNRKKVEHVRIKLSGKALDQGYSIVDLPGLDDPNDVVRSSAEIALETCDALLYVLNGAPMATGSFMFTVTDKQHLKQLAPRIRKTFFVVNKSDAFDPAKQAAVRKYLQKEVSKAGLGEIPDNAIFFVSALKSLEFRTGHGEGSSDESIRRLETALLDFLISNSLTGRNRLKGILSQSAQLVSEQLTIHSVVIGKAEKAEALRQYLSDFDRVQGEVQGMVSEGCFATVEQMKSTVSEFRNRSFGRFHQTLTEVPLTTPLPSRDDVRAWLEAEISRMAGEGQSVVQRSFEACATRANTAVNRVMAELRSAVIRLGQGVFVPQIQGVGDQININPWTPFWGALGLGLAGLAFGPIGALVGAAVGLLIGWFGGEQRRRQQEREALLQRVRTILADSADKISVQLESTTRTAFEDLRNGLTVRIEESRRALKEQLSGMRDLPSLAQQERLKSAISQLNSLSPRLSRALSET